MLSKREQKIIEKLKVGYDSYALDFARSRQGLIWPELQKILLTVEAGSKVLDLGCGSGRIISLLPSGIKYLGIDNGQKLLESAQTRFPNYSFQLGDLIYLPKLTKEKFNYIICAAVWHHLPSCRLRKKLLLDMKSRLELNGKIIISVWDLWHNPKLKSKAFLSLLSFHPGDVFFLGFKNKDYRYYHAFTKYEIKRLAKKAGLKVEKFSVADGNYYLILGL
jgi:SAM-dependent methyltransferase